MRLALYNVGFAHPFETEVNTVVARAPGPSDLVTLPFKKLC